MGGVQYAPRWLYSAQKDPRGALHYQSELSLAYQPWNYPIICVRFDTLTLPRAAQGLLSSLIPYLPTYGRSRGHQSGRLADRHTTTRPQTPPAPDCRTRTQAAASMIASRCNPLPMPEVPRSAAQSSLRITHPSLRPYLGPVGVYGGGITGGARRRGRPAFLLRVAEV